MTATIYERLKEPFRGSDIKWRAGATYEKEGQLMALALPFIDARAVMDRLDEIVGPGDWKDSYIETGSGFIATISIRIELSNGEYEWITKSDGADRTNFEPAKGGISDSFKRAGVKWGIGRYLYTIKADWVPCTKKGKRVLLDDTPILPISALPKDDPSLKDRGKKRGPTATTAGTNRKKAPAKKAVETVSEGNGKTPPTGPKDYESLYKYFRDVDDISDKDVQKALSEVGNDAVKAFELIGAGV